MRCQRCHAEIPDGYLYCEVCGKEVQMVPDYNPLEDVLTAQVRGAMDEEPQEEMPVQAKKEPQEKFFRPESVRNENGMISYTMRIPLPSANMPEEEESAEMRETPPPRKKAVSAPANEKRPENRSRDSRSKEIAERERRMRERRRERDEEAEEIKDRPSSLRERKRQREEEQRRKEMEERKKKRRAKQRAGLFGAAAALVCFLVLCVFLYLNSYAGLVRTGNRYFKEGKTDEAQAKFTRAVRRDDSQADAYDGLAKIYLAANDAEKTEQMYLEAVKKYPSNVELYKACIRFYQETDQLAKISVLLDGCKDQGVLDDLNMYVSPEPKFSLEEETYDDVQQLSMKTSGEAIYYTVDGSEPTTASTKYTEPLRIGEGTTVVRAIAINKEGVPSMETARTYTVEFPIVDAPAVSPSTGRYEQPMQITVQVPEGYTAYYTIGDAKSEIELPTAASKQYTGPVDMPEGNHIFCAVLIDSKGRASQVKKMNYELAAQ